MKQLCASCIAFSTVVVFCCFVPLARGEKARLAVMPLDGKRMPAETVEILDDLLVSEVGRKSGSTVIGTRDINAILGLDKMKDALGCNDVSCAAEIGGALGVELLLTGNVSVLGDELIVNLTLINIHESVVTQRAQARVAKDERYYAYAISLSVAQLFGLPKPEPPQRPSPKRAHEAPIPRRTVEQPTPLGRGDLQLTSYLANTTGWVQSAADGQKHECAEPLKHKDCYLKNLPPGPATVTFVLPERELTQKIVIQPGHLGRQMRVGENPGKIPRIVIGAVFTVVGAVVLPIGLTRENTGTVYNGEPTWSVGKTLSVSLGSGALLAGAAVAIWGLAADPITVWDSAQQPAVPTSK